MKASRILPLLLAFLISTGALAQEDLGTGEKERETQLRTWQPMVWPDSSYENIIKATYLMYDNRFAIHNDVVEGNWRELGPVNFPEGTHKRHIGIGRVNTVIFHPRDEQKMFVCSPTGGMFYSEDGGESWQNGGTDFLPTAAAAWVLPDPRIDGRWVLATGDGDGDWVPSAGIFITNDKGKNWKDISKGLPFPTATWDALRITKLAGHPANLRTVYAATNKGLYVCDNVLAPDPSWRKVWDGQFNDVEFRPFKPNVIWAAGEVIIHSNDSGKKWRIVPGSDFTKIGYKIIKTNLEMSAADNTKVYAAVTGIDPKKGTYKAKLYCWEDAKNAWEFRSQIMDKSYMPYGLIPGRDKALVVSPTNPERIWAANVNPVYRSEDGGRTWSRMSYGMHDDIHHLRFSDGGKTMWGTNDGGIYKSTDEGHTWENKTNGIGVCNVLGMSITEHNPDKVVIGTYDTGSSLFDRKTGKWVFKTGGDGYGNMFDPRSDSVFYTSSVGGNVHRWDGRQRRGVSAPRSGSDWQTWIDVNQENPDIIYQCGKSLWRSNKMGNTNTWESILDVKTQYPGYKKVIRCYAAPGDGDVVYAVLIGSYPVKLVRTMNATAPADQVKWEDIEHPENAWIIDMTIHDKDPEQYWIAYSKVGDGFRNKVYYNNGRMWKSLAFDLPDFVTVNGIAYEFGSHGKVYIGTNSGVFFTDNRCKQWYLLKGLPHCQARLLRINQKHKLLVAGTFGRGVWECDLPKERK